MRGVVLAGGLGTRLRPLTSVVNKHLLPVYNQPMIFYALDLLVQAGIREVIVVVGGQSTEAIMKLCKDGRTLGFRRMYYVYQDGEGGIGAALALTEQFAGGQDLCVVLGDNILLGESIRDHRYAFEGKNPDSIGAQVLLKQVSNPSDYGVVRFENKKIAEIVEKPISPPSDLAVTGIYFYDNTVFSKLRQCTPSARGEIEITEVNNRYADEGRLQYRFIKGVWIDAGSSIEGLIEASKQVESFKTHVEQKEEVMK